MGQYMNEELMWQRLQDLQLEAENRRLLSGRVLPSLLGLAGLLGRRAWWLGGLAMRRPPRRRPAPAAGDGRDAATRAA